MACTSSNRANPGFNVGEKVMGNLYRKKPVVIEAVQWLGTAQSFNEIISSFPSMKWSPGEMGSKTFIVDTLEGEHIASCGDYIIKGVAGEFYPCKPEIFLKTYEEC